MSPHFSRSPASPARRGYRFGGNLYQLFSSFELHFGAYVEVNGPHDTYGKVLRSERTSNGEYLNLIRGIPPEPNVQPIASF